MENNTLFLAYEQFSWDGVQVGKNNCIHFLSIREILKPWFWIMRRLSVKTLEGASFSPWKNHAI